MRLPTPQAVGRPEPRTEGPDKVTGRALYAAEYDVEGVTYGWLVQSAVAAGTVTDIGAGAARDLPGVIDVLWHRNAPALAEPDDAELSILQSAEVSYRGQVVAIVIATTLDAARRAQRWSGRRTTSGRPRWCCGPTTRISLRRRR